MAGRKYNLEKLKLIWKLDDEGLEPKVIALRTGYSPSHIYKLRHERIEIIKSLTPEERMFLGNVLPSQFQVDTPQVCSESEH